MTTAFVVMTALPPTKGHLYLLQFSAELADKVVAIVCTQPGEPFAEERFVALRTAMRRTGKNVVVRHFHKTVEQNPEAPGFWQMWREIMVSFGYQQGDLIVASESYGKRFAYELDGVFMPYDPARATESARARIVRRYPEVAFHKILPDFQHVLRPTVTLIGAESIGKSTLIREMNRKYRSHMTVEWARPYLESLDDKTITTEKMNTIWKGQRALQLHAANNLKDRPWLFQDTDLFATVGYWNFWDGNTPKGLVDDAYELRSDLYIIPQSNIPFEHDSIRYGGEERESTDQYWIDLCEFYKLNYVVLTSDTVQGRMEEVGRHLVTLWNEKVRVPLSYERQYND